MEAGLGSFLLSWVCWPPLPMSATSCHAETPGPHPAPSHTLIMAALQRVHSWLKPSKDLESESLALRQMIFLLPVLQISHPRREPWGQGPPPMHTRRNSAFLICPEGF